MGHKHSLMMHVGLGVLSFNRLQVALACKIVAFRGPLTRMRTNLRPTPTMVMQNTGAR